MAIQIRETINLVLWFSIHLQKVTNFTTKDVDAGINVRNPRNPTHDMNHDEPHSMTYCSILASTYSVWMSFMNSKRKKNLRPWGIHGESFMYGTGDFRQWEIPGKMEVLTGKYLIDWGFSAISDHRIPQENQPNPRCWYMVAYKTLKT